MYHHFNENSMYEYFFAISCLVIYNNLHLSSKFIENIDYFNEPF